VSSHSPARKIALRARAREFRRVMTPAETMLWKHLRAHQFADLHIRRQQVIGGFIADFSCHAVRLIIEVDGKIHETTIERDTERDHILAEHGWHVVRFSNERVLTNLDACLIEIRAAVDRGFPSPDPSPAAAGEGNSRQEP
jgi:very-short-patch-repair endonuclease